MEGLDNHTTYFLGLVLLGGGIVFVLSSFFALGFTGTFLGKTLRYGVTLDRYTGVQGGAESCDCHLCLMCLEKHWGIQPVMVRTDQFYQLTGL